MHGVDAHGDGVAGIAADAGRLRALTARRQQAQQRGQEQPADSTLTVWKQAPREAQFHHRIRH